MRHGWARHVIKEFETNPEVQFRFHLCAMLFWIVNLVVGTCIMFLDGRLWLQVGVFYVFALSIYANWDTDYDAVSASLAAKHALTILAQRENDELA